MTIGSEPRAERAVRPDIFVEQETETVRRPVGPT